MAPPSPAPPARATRLSGGREQRQWVELHRDRHQCRQLGSATSRARRTDRNCGPHRPTDHDATSESNGDRRTDGSPSSVAANGGNAPFAVSVAQEWHRHRGATASSYTTPATVSGDNGSSFTVIVTNATGSMTSNAATLTVTAAAAGTDVVTYKYDVMRTGQNLAESTLTLSNVVSATFGKLRNLMVDGLVDAQPLYLSQLAVAGAMHNVVFVATEHDSVYAFDADTGAILWKVSLLGSGRDYQRQPWLLPGDAQKSASPRHCESIWKGGDSWHDFLVVADDQGCRHPNYPPAAACARHYDGTRITSSQDPTEIAATFAATTFAPERYHKERCGIALEQRHDLPRLGRHTATPVPTGVGSSSLSTSPRLRSRVF